MSFFARLYNSLYRNNFRYTRFYAKLYGLFNYGSKDHMMRTAMRFAAASQLEGDYLEFGVFAGGSFVSATKFARNFGLKNMRFYGFDSFEGLPSDSEMTEEGKKQFKKGQFACDQKSFVKILKKYKVDLKRVTLVPGYYDKSLKNSLKKKLSLKKAAVIWIDCDLYESTVPVLNFITSYLQDGTIIMFDDWYCFKGNPNKGEQKAFREWRVKNRKWTVTPYQSFGWHGMSFILNKK